MDITTKQQPQSAATAPSHQDDLIKRSSQMFASGKYCDLVITCSGRTFNVHRSVICLASSFFAAACDGVFSESTAGQIDLKDDDAATVERMLSYLYTADYNDGHDDLKEASSANPAPRESCLRGNVMVYAIAEKYDIPGLKNLAKDKFALRVPVMPANEDLLGLLRLTYASTPQGDRGIRDILSRVAEAKVEDILSNQSLLVILEQDKEWIFDMMRAVSKAKQQLQEEVHSLKRGIEGVVNADEKIQKVFKQETEELEKDLEKAENRLDRKIELANAILVCEHCGGSFNVDSESSENESSNRVPDVVGFSKKFVVHHWDCY